MKIFGISGTNGAGKDTVSEMLAERHNFFVVSATEMLADGLRLKGWPVDREHKRKLSSEWRRSYGMSAIVDRGIELFEPVKDKFSGIIIGSLRHPGEADRIHVLGGQVIWVDADPKIRYGRITSASRGVNKALEDKKTFEEFLAEEQVEMRHEGDKATLNNGAVKELADIFLENNGADKEKFKDYAEKVLELV